MVKKKLDNRIRKLIENGVVMGHRSQFIVVGNKARDQVMLLHHILSKSTVKARPSVLWCYKNDPRAKAEGVDVNKGDPFELFVLSTNIRYCKYNDTHEILGRTYGMCILQDFEALTPNLLARTIETVEGGGIIVFLLQNVTSLKQLFTMNMDVHQRYRTEAHQDVVCRFNERFLLSLSSCDRCLVVNDQLQVLPISSRNLKIEPVSNASLSPDQDDLNSLKESLRDTQPVSALINCCKTMDQAKSLLKFIDAISEKTLRSTVSLTAARGRGKSATLGLAIAGAIAFGYSNIYITSLNPENLNTLFEFIFKGFDALEYKEHLDYGLVQSEVKEFNKALVRINVFRDHRQTIQYIHPTDVGKLSQTELLVIDEAAAIPLPYVEAMLGPYLTFLASTINGYEGTGRSLSLKLLQQLRTQTSSNAANSHEKSDYAKAISGRQFQELTLEESIRYKPGDAVEKWLNDLLCLDAMGNAPILSGCPALNICQLYYINRDTLFSHHKVSEQFLQRLMALYVASHYKNSPNDLQMMSDAPGHHLFCLMGPVNPDKKSLPEILVVIQVCLEGGIKKKTISGGLGQGRLAAGGLIPWLIAQQYNDKDFPSLSGARIVRISTHPDYLRMGYGKKAVDQLKHYYQGDMFDLDVNTAEESQTEIVSVQDTEVDLLEETIEPRTSLPPLLLKLNERRPEKLNYIGVSFGLTLPLLKFWKKTGFVPAYIRQTANDITGEHSCVMLCSLDANQEKDTGFLNVYWKDFRERFITLLSGPFRDYSPPLALGILTNNATNLEKTVVNKQALDLYFTSYDLKRLEMYSKNMANYLLILDRIPSLAELYFLNLMGNIEFSPAQAAILLGLGLQHKTKNQLILELALQAEQVLGLFNRLIRRSMQFFNSITEDHIRNTMLVRENVNENIKVNAENGKSLQEELETADKELRIKQKTELEKLKRENFEQYQIKGTDEDWQSALAPSKNSKSLVSIKIGEKRGSLGDLDLETPKTKKVDKHQKRKKRFPQ